MTKKQLATRLPGDKLYCSCRKNTKLTEFDVVATVIKNDPENERITLHRAIKYGTLDVRAGSENKDGIITFDYDKIMEYYEPLHPAYKSLISLQNSMPENTEVEKDILYTLEEYLVEADDGCFYESASLWCLQNKIKDVTDIGSLYGFQAEFFVSNGIKYTGVDETDTTILAPAATADNSLCLNNTKYPCELPHGTMALSSLCIGYLCTGEEVYKKLSEQFEYFALDNEQEKELIEKYWTEIYRETKSPYTRECRLVGKVDDKKVTRIIVYKRKEV